MRRHLKSCVAGVSCLPFFGLPAFAGGALPAGGGFISGAGSVAKSATSLTVNQTTKYGIVNWGSFSIGQGNSVQFNNANGATLNRVSGNLVSTISGSLTSLGSIYLINQRGIVVTPTGQVVTGGDFVASTRETSNIAFMQGGNLEFTGTSSGTVTNQGSIATGGNAVLIGKSSTNSGSISAPNGVAALTAGDDVILQPGGTRLQIKVNTGSGDATNSGNIAAAQAMLNAAGGNVYALAGNNSSVISASGTANIDGHVWLTAGGSVDITAPINSSGEVTINGGGAAYSAVNPNIGTVNSATGNTPTGADGVYINNVVNAGGPISITGSGGNAGALENYGVMIDFNGVIQTTGNAPINITGTGGGLNTGTFGNDGVFILGTVGVVSGGPVTITGTGGNSGGPDNFGVTNEGAVLSGNGNITITGTSSGGPGAEDPNSIGIGQVGVVNLGLIESGTGNISITGTVGANATGAGNSGVGIGGGMISTGGNGNIDITGTSSGALGSNSGVLILDYGFGAPAVTTVDGHIQVTGTNTGVDAGSDSGVAIVSGSVTTAGHGDVQITGNGGTLDSDADIVIGGVPGDPASVTAGGNLTVEGANGIVVVLPGGSL